jgi:hypothetical protein
MTTINRKTDSSKSILIVLDLNGVLFDRIRRGSPEQLKMNANKLVPDGIFGPFQVFNRPYLNEFIDFLHDRFTVAVWSSVMPHNLNMLIDHAWGKERRKKLLFTWSQDKCTTIGTFPGIEKKPVFLKETLKKIFWTPSKVLLLDDSKYKAVNNMAFTSIHPTQFSVSSSSEKDDDEFSANGSLRSYLEKLIVASERGQSVSSFVSKNAYHHHHHHHHHQDDDLLKKEEEEKVAHVMELLARIDINNNRKNFNDSKV